ncbi:hypothetical protein HDU91_000276 [Kappamyces sp. JEL0680]|nr:hypothetical protein HDU91_000276 [Kappamyces sp. JEL0680]
MIRFASVLLLGWCFAMEPITLSMTAKTTFEERFPATNALVSKVTTGSSAPLKPDNDIVYTVPVKVGKQTFMMDLDTGSSDTWVKSANCTNVLNDGSCTGQKLDTNDPSVSLFPGKNDFVFAYGLGNASGLIYTAPVSLAGKTTTLPIGVANQANHMSGHDGILGLGFDTLSSLAKITKQPSTFFDLLGFTGTQAMFSFYLSNAADGDQGEVTIGGYNTDRFIGDIKWIPVDKPGYWSFSLNTTTVSVRGQSFPIANMPVGSSAIQSAIFDTGTTQIILSQAVGTAVNKAIGASDNGFIPCSVATNGPRVEFSIDGNVYPVPPSIYVRRSGSQCVTGFSTNADALGIIIFGDVMNRAFYTIYSKAVAGSPAVGLATAVHPSNSAPGIGAGTNGSTGSPSTGASGAALSTGVIAVIALCLLVLIALGTVAYVRARRSSAVAAASQPKPSQPPEPAIPFRFSSLDRLLPPSVLEDGTKDADAKSSFSIPAPVFSLPGFLKGMKDSSQKLYNKSKPTVRELPELDKDWLKSEDLGRYLGIQ